MHALITVGGIDYRVDFGEHTDLSIPLDFHGEQPAAFGIPAAHAAPLRAGDFVGAVAQGGSANCYTVTMTPHGNGTHTESIGHVLRELVPIGPELTDTFIPATLLSVDLQRLGACGESYPDGGDEDDFVITQAELAGALARAGNDPTWLRALIVRTRPNPEGKRHANYSGHNPAYLTREAMAFVRTLQVEHLLVDVPSVDREEDHGALANHRIFWDLEPGQTEDTGAVRGRTITELIFAPDALTDGTYLLNLQVPDFLLDAAPSRPRLFGAVRWQG